MKKLFNSIFFIFIVYNTSAAQNLQIAYFDSLINKSLFLSEKSLFAANFDEAERYISISHFEKFDLFNDKHKLKLKIQLIRIKSFKNTLGMANTNSNKILNTIIELLPSTKNIQDENLLGDYFTLLSSGFYSIGSKDSTNYYHKIALHYYNETNNIKKIAQIRASKISRKHNALKAKGRIDKVLLLIPEFEKEIDFSEMCDNKYVLAYNTRHLAQIYLKHTSNLQKALKLFKISLELRDEIGFIIFLPASYYSIGEVAEKMGNRKTAVEMYNKSIAIADRIGFVRYKYLSRLKMGEVFEKENDLVNAKKYFIESLKIASLSNYEKGIQTAIQKIEDLNQ